MTLRHPSDKVYASSLLQVIEEREKVAHANLQVLRQPAPQCLFMGYGESSIDLEQRALTEQFIDYARVRSKLNSAIYEAVKAAGMSCTFPRREVRLPSDREA